MIKPIDRKSVHQICSGQVVLTLAVAIKELVENSLDAGATHIDVKLKACGTKLIQVTDNGSGIEESDFQGITLKHHTSKITDFADLPGVETFGFRGEALSSLCAMSELSVHTRHSSCRVGTKLDFDSNGAIVHRQPLPRGQVGTTVSAANLFSALPVRRREFERNAKREMGRAVQLLTAYCLVHPRVRIAVSNQGADGRSTSLLATDGRGAGVQDAIGAVFGPRAVQNLLPVKEVLDLSEELVEEFRVKKTAPELRLTGWVSSAAHGAGRSAPDRQFFFINGRPCEPGRVGRVANDVYRTLNRHQFPTLVLDVALRRGDVDVNVTPDKRSLFVDNEPFLLAVVKASMQATLEVARPEVTSAPGLDAPPAGPVKPEALDGSLTALLRRRVAENRQSGSPKQRRLDFSKITAPSATKWRRPPSPPAVDGGSPGQDPSARLSLSFVDSRGHASASEALPPSACGDGASPGPPARPASPPRAARAPEALPHSACGDGPSPGPPAASRPPHPPHAASPGPQAAARATEALMDSLLATMDDSDGEAEGGEARHEARADAAFSLAELRARLGARAPAANGEAAGGRRFLARIEPGDNSQAEQELQRHLRKEDFLRMEVIGQFNLGFLVVRLDDDLFIVDQHATDEKFNFERLEREHTMEHQRLIRPVRLELTAAQEMVVLDNVSVFEKNGFRFSVDEEAPAGRRVQLISTPVSKNWDFGVSDIEEMIFVLDETGTTNVRPSKVRRMLASRACRSSIMIGTALNEAEMKRVVHHMAEMDVPWSCPHGRPTIRHLANMPIIRLALGVGDRAQDSG